MQQNIITASYNNAITVSFTNDAWFNATEVAKQYKQNPKDWLNQRDTVEYIATLADMIGKLNCGFLHQFNEISKLDSESAVSRAKLLKLVKQTELVKTKGGSPENGGGSWFHPKLAIAFARWLDVKFSIWCDMQIEQILHKRQPIQYGLKDPINEPEPLRICYATKEQREPLVKAVRRLVSVAAEKGKSISYENAHSIINLKMGVSSVEELTLEQIPQAMSLVGDILERVVLEGEFIARGEPEPVKVDSPPFTNKDEQSLKKIVGFAKLTLQQESAWTQAIYYRLRTATGVKSPAPFRISDKPILAKEFERIFTVTERTRNMITDFERDVIKRLVRGEENLDAVFAEHEAKNKDYLKELDGEIKVLLYPHTRNAISEFAA